LRVRFHRWQIGIGKAVSRRPPDAGAGPSPAAAEEEIASERTLLENRWAAPIAEVRPRIAEVRQRTEERPGQGAPPPLLRVRSSNRSVPFPSRDGPTTPSVRSNARSASWSEAAIPLR